MPVPRPHPVRRRRPARVAVLVGALAVVVLQLGFGLACEYYPRLRDPFFGDKLVKLQRRMKATPEPSVVVLGTSRTGLGFHGKVAEERLTNDLGRPVVAFNYGIPASGPITHLVYFRRLLDAGVPPNLLVLEVLPSMLVDDPKLAPLEKNWLAGDRLTYSEQAVVIGYGFDAEKVHSRWRESATVPWYALRIPLMSRLSPSWVPVRLQTRWSQDADECGWGKMLNQSPTLAERRKGETQAAAEYGPVLSTLTPGGHAADALREIIRECQARKITIRILLMPEGSYFRGFYPPVVLERVTAFLGGLGVPVTNARSWLPDDRFFDGHHMTERGAEEFSDRLAHEVLAADLKAAGY